MPMQGADAQGECAARLRTLLIPTQWPYTVVSEFEGRMIDSSAFQRPALALSARTFRHPSSRQGATN